MELKISYLNQNKIFTHLDRLDDWLKKRITKPITIEIDPTNTCNHNCPGCAGNKFCPNCSLSLAFMKKIINQLSPFCKGLVFTGGGNPLCNRETLDVILYAKKKGIDVGLIATGSLLTKEISKKLVKACTWIRISVDADNAKYYSSIHGVKKEMYSQVLRNIKGLTEAKRETNSDCTIGIGFLTSKKSARQMFPFSKRMKSLGVDYVQFRPFHFDKFNPLKQIARCKKMETLKFKIVVSQHRYDKIIGDYPIAFRDEFNTVIAADGKIYPCCFTRGMKEFELGDLNKTSFDKIWNSKRKKEIFKNKLKMRSCPAMCKYDSLSQTLWEILKINKEGKHLSFV